MPAVFRSPPAVSVIIPAYNCDRYLPEAIDSVLHQTEQNFELIVVDDGSTDRTAEILQTYQQQLPHILRTVRQPNQGVAIARNHGIQLAQSEWIAFLDADDAFLPDKLAAQLAIAQASNVGASAVGIVHSGWQRISATGELLMQVEPWRQIPKLDLESWLRWKPVLPSAMLFRRDWLARSGGFDPRFPPAEDTELVLRLARLGCRSIWLPQVTVRYRQHENSAMHQGLPQAQSLAAVIDHFFAQPDLPPAIRPLESQVRYSTLIWIAWYLHHSGHPAEMRRTLQQARQYAPHSPVEAIVHWADCFASHAANWGIDFDAQALTASIEWQMLINWMLRGVGGSPASRLPLHIPSSNAAYPIAPIANDPK